METQKQVVHFQAKKGFTTAQSNEHQRRWTERGWERANENGRIDRTRVALNFEIVKGGKLQAVDKSKSIPEKFRENITARELKDPNEKCPDNPKYRTVVDFIISGSHERLCQLAFGKQEVDLSPGADNSRVRRRPEIERWAKDMYDALAGKYGEENILSFIVHLDERTPHIHADLIPVTEDNLISFNQVFAGGNKYEFRRRSLALHDMFGKVNEKWGLERGDSVAVTHAKKKSHEEYRRELSSQCSTLEKEVDRKSATLKISPMTALARTGATHSSRRKSPSRRSWTISWQNSLTSVANSRMQRRGSPTSSARSPHRNSGRMSSSTRSRMPPPRCPRLP